jgi:hypothetical protein
MENTNKFTCLKLDGCKLVTGDSMGNIVSWNLDTDPVSHEIKGSVGEEILEVFVSGLTILCRTVSGKIYHWTMHSQRYGAEIGLRIAECELINTISSLDLGLEGYSDDVSVDYELSLDLYHPTLRVYSYYFLNLINIEDGEVLKKFTSDEERVFSCFRMNGFQFQSDCYITPDGIVDVESENLIAKFGNSFGQEEIERHEEENPELYADPSPEMFDSENFPMFQGKSITAEYIYKVRHPQNSLYAFVELAVDFAGKDFEEEDETNDFYYIRIAGISNYDISNARDYLETWEDYKNIELDAIHDFKIKKTEAVKLSFCVDKLGTINQAGNVKIFDIKNKSVLHELKPLEKPQTNEFGDEVL